MSSTKLVVGALIILLLAILIPFRVVVFGALGVAVAMWAGLMASIALVSLLIVGWIVLRVDRLQAQREASEFESETSGNERDHRRAA